MEENWTAALIAGDESALQEIIRQKTGYVYTIVRNFSKGRLSTEDMEEITADVFISLWKNRERLRMDAALSPYLAATARNNVKNRFRAMGKHAPVRQSLEELTLPDTRNLCDDAEKMEAITCLVCGLELLTDTERELVVRFYFYGEKTSVIAKAKGLSDAAVRVSLHRSRGKLRRYMAERGFDDAEAADLV